MLCVAFSQMFLFIIIVRSLRLACAKVGHSPSKKQNNNKLWMYCSGHAVINGNEKTHYYTTDYYGSGDSSVVRAPDSWFKGRGFKSLQERRENFVLQGQLSVLTLISVSVPPPRYRSKRSRSFCQKCRWLVTAEHTYTLRMWLCIGETSKRRDGAHMGFSERIVPVWKWTEVNWTVRCCFELLCPVVVFPLFGCQLASQF